MSKVVKRWKDFPIDDKGIYKPCPICGRIYCDHTPDERMDEIWYIETDDGDIKPE